MERDGKRISRRQAIGAAGTAGLSAWLIACGDDDGTGDAAPTEAATSSTTTPTAAEPAEATGGRISAADFDPAGSCTLTAEQTEGPFFIDIDGLRSDIREDRGGTPLQLGLRVRESGSCEPIADAVVEIWHADASGSYSGFGSRGAAPGSEVPADGSTFLRGGQATDREGIARFETIYPGWYPGRTPHIHVKVTLGSSEALTSQLYFDPETSLEVYDSEPYSGRGEPSVLNDGDSIFDSSLVMSLSRTDPGYRALFTLDVNRA